MNLLRQYLGQLRTWWGTLEPGPRKQIAAAAIVALLSVAAVGWWSSQETWRPLLSGRSYDELLTAAAALDNQGLPYRLDDGVLSVPDDKLGRARAAVSASQTLPGLDDVSDLKLGLTPQAQEWAFLRAREGDLARMVNGIAGVAASQVNIVPRAEALFSDEQTAASASVFVKVRPGVTIEGGQVRAIVNLVAGAVDGLSPDQVTVVDDRGNLLADGAGSGAANLPDSLHELRTAMERRFEQSVGSALLPVLGDPTAFSVTATVDLDLESTETVTRKVDTTKQALVSEQLEETVNEAGTTGGVPGVDANLPERAAPAGADATRSERSATTMNYDYPSVDEVRRKPAGGMKRVSVAVQVDSARLAAIVGEGGDAKQLETRIQEAIQAAVGFDQQRGDQVQVSFLPFAERAWVEASAGPVATSVTSMAPYAVASLGMLLLFGTVVRPLVRAATSVPTPATETVADAEGDAATQAEPEPDPDDDLADRLRLLVDNFEAVDASDLNRLVDREAHAAAQVLRQWTQGGG